MLNSVVIKSEFFDAPFCMNVVIVHDIKRNFSLIDRSFKR